MIQKGISLILMLSLLLSLCACANDDPPISDVDASGAPENIQHFDIPTENVKASYRLSHGAPSTTGTGYYTANKVLKYTDVDTKQTVVLCAQSGCDHSDASCQAWVGDEVDYICEYAGVIYATLTEDDGALTFLKKDISTGERTIIDSWPLEKEEDVNRTLSLGTFADGKCVVTLSIPESIPIKDGESYWQSYKHQTYIYDLSTNQRQEIPEEYNDWSLPVICSDRVLFTHNGLSSTGELQALYGDDYLQYYIPSKMVEYNMTTGESKTIATEAEGLLFTGDPATTYGYLYVYQMGDDFCIYDLESSTSRVVTTMENVLNFWILDHKLFLIEHLEDGESYKIYIYYMDIDGGDLIRMENNGNTDVMYFSVSWEGNGFFVGNRGGNKVIRKEDFYAENYTKDWGGGY